MNWSQIKYETVKLGDICKNLDGKRRPLNNKERNKIRGTGKYPYFGANNIMDWVDEYIFDEKILCIAEDGGNWGNNQKCSFIYNGKCWVNNHAHVLSGKDNVILEFLMYYLNFADLDSYITGSTRGKLTKSSLDNLQIPLPSLEVQQQIAALLDRADTLRQLDRQLLTHYDTLIQSVFLEMFGDPVKNEKGWEVKKFGEVGESRLGKMLDSKKQNGASKFPYLGNSNVLWGGFKLENLLEMDFDEKDRKEFVLKKGDLLICEGGEVGRTAIWNIELENVYFQKALHRVRLNPKIAEPQYILRLMWFLAHRGGLKDFVTVSTIAHLTGAKLKSLPIPVPPLALQQRFAAIVEKIEAQKATAAAQAEASEALFQSLLQKAFGSK